MRSFPAQARPAPGIDQLRSGDGSGVRACGAPDPHSGRDLAGGAGRHGGLERSYFGRIERGKNQPTLYVIIKVAAALGYEPGALVTLVERAMAEESGSVE